MAIDLPKCNGFISKFDFLNQDKTYIMKIFSVAQKI
jgi:hypothetical protein